MHIHPDKVRAILGSWLDDVTIARLLACDRLRRRLELCFETVPDADDPRTEVDRDEPMLRAAPAWLLADPVDTAKRAGAILHGRAIRCILSGSEVAALVASIGREAHALGLRHWVEAPPRDHGHDLANSILRDGAACLETWLQRRPSPVCTAVLLTMPPELLGRQVEESVDAEAVMDIVARSYSSGGDTKAAPDV